MYTLPVSSDPVQVQEGHDDNERANLVSFIQSQWSTEKENLDTSTSTSTMAVLNDNDIVTTPETTTMKSIMSTTTEEATPSTSTPQIMELIVIVNNTGPSIGGENPQREESGAEQVSIIEAVPSSGDNRETVFVIRQPIISGSVAGIIKEALGLVQNTIRLVGVNLLAAPLLLGAGGTTLGNFNGINGQVVRLNSTHVKIIRGQ